MTGLLSQSGRILHPPVLRPITSSRTADNALRKIDEWLMAEALAEAQGNDYITTQLRGINVRHVSPADRDMLNLVLFGDGLVDAL